MRCLNGWHILSSDFEISFLRMLHRFCGFQIGCAHSPSSFSWSWWIKLMLFISLSIKNTVKEHWCVDEWVLIDCKNETDSDPRFLCNRCWLLPYCIGPAQGRELVNSSSWMEDTILFNNWCPYHNNHMHIAHANLRKRKASKGLVLLQSLDVQQCTIDSFR